MTIAIIGGGFSGTAIAINICLNISSGRLRVLLINPEATFARGLAYGFEDDNLLLNVPAGNMSVMSNDSSHFVNYCQAIDPSINGGSFVSRRIYGRYLQETLIKTQNKFPSIIEEVKDYALAINQMSDLSTWQITLSKGQSIVADHIVLAVGHQYLKMPIHLGNAESKHVYEPWDFSALKRLPPNQPILILGTGHTAVDVLFCLSQTHEQRRVYMVSRHGLIPHSHRINSTPPDSSMLPNIVNEVQPSIRNYTRFIRKTIRTMGLHGVNWRDVLNSIRPLTARLWQSLPATDQQRFIRHLKVYWDIHRHRLAPMASNRLEYLLSTNQVQIIAGRILTAKKIGDKLNIQLRVRGKNHPEIINACAIVNCTGSNTDLTCDVTSLLSQLLKAGLIQQDANRLGVLVTSDHQILNANNQRVDGLWCVGPMLKAQYWEATAVPELRIHAQQLALTLVEHTKKKFTEVVD